jgi:hypothetical protein
LVQRLTIFILIDWGDAEVVDDTLQLVLADDMQDLTIATRVA